MDGGEGLVILPLQITFRDMNPSKAVAAHVRKRAEKLNLFYDRIVACRVMVEVPHRHHLHGKRYHVRIDVTVPGCELVVGRNPADNINHENMHAAVDDAFDDAERMVGDHAKRRHDWR